MTTKLKVMRKFSLSFLLLANGVFAQNTTAIIENISNSGLHQIVIPAEIRSLSKSDFSDFRIYDERGTEIPYKLQMQQTEKSTFQFKPFTIVSRNSIPKKNSEIVIEIPLSENNEITLYIANAEVTKKFSVSGSYDQKHWFGLVNNREWAYIQNERSTSAYKSIPLPLNKYKFLKIAFDDKKTLPLNVIQAGYFQSSKSDQQLSEVIKAEKISTSKNKESKQTVLRFNFKKKPFVGQLKFEVSSPNFYNRHARLYKYVTFKNRRKDIVRQETIAEFELNSDKNNTFSVDPIAETIFYLEIDDRDNPPLKFSKIEFAQQLLTVIADLEAQKKYTVKTGNPKMQLPDYDLFNDSHTSNDSLPKATIAAIAFHQNERIKSENDSLWQKPWFMWFCITVGGIAILYFSIALIKDLNK